MRAFSRMGLGAACAFIPLSMGPAALAGPGVPDEIRIVVGGNAGGGFDTYARLIAAHLPEHLGGGPSVIVQNMPGAGSALAAEYIANAAAADGAVIGAIYPGAIVGSLLFADFGDRYDPQELVYLATANVSSRVCVTAEPRTEEALKTEAFILGADAPGGSPYDYGYLFQNAVNPSIQVVPGYPGTRDILAAMERGEVDGMCGIDFSSLRSIVGTGIEEGRVHVVVQYATAPDAELDALGAIPFQELVVGEDREAVALIIDQQVFGRPYVMSPQSPEETVEALRAGFAAMFADAGFTAEAERLHLDLRWADGAELQRTVEEMFASDPETVTRARALLAPR